MKVRELAPLDVSFRLMRGDTVDGTSWSGDDLRFSFRAEPQDTDTETTLVGRVRGMGEMGWDLLLTPQVPSYGAQQSSSGGRWMGAFNYRIPLEEVKQLKIPVKPLSATT